MYLPDASNPILIVSSVGLGLVLWLTLRGAVGHLSWVAVIRTLTRIQARILDRLFARFVSLSMKERSGNTSSEQKHILLLSAQAMFHQVFYPLTSVIVEGVIAIVSTLLFLEPVATTILFVWVGLLLGLYHICLRSKASRVGQARWRSLDAMRRVIDGALGDLRWVKITNAEKPLRSLFSKQTETYAEALAQDRALTVLPRYIIDIAILASILILFIYFFAAGTEGDALFPGFALFAAAALRLMPAFYRLISLSHSLTTHAPDLSQVIDSLGEEISEHSPVQNSDTSQPLFLTDLTLHEVSFKYPETTQEILSGITSKIRRGDRVLVTGASGSGKSTFLCICLGLIEPSKGTVFLDGDKVSVLDAVRKSPVALVSQDPFIAEGTVADNIAFPGASTTLDADKALGLLNALDLQWSLNRQVGENGTQLSGGERQRLAIARALYLSPDFLVLDEATSQMDETTAHMVYDLIFETCPKATVLLCTHQKVPSTLCSRHLMVREGQVFETK